ncbi:MAG: hypothetical protein ACK4N5_04840 [Myxococcales bacterium]
MRVLILLLVSAAFLLSAPADARRRKRHKCLYGYDKKEKRCFESADEASKHASRVFGDSSSKSGGKRRGKH